MTIIRKTVYTTPGGQTFDSLAEALAHENAPAIVADLEKIPCLYVQSGLAFSSQICGDIADHAAEILTILLRHINEKDWLNQAYPPEPGLVLQPDPWEIHRKVEAGALRGVADEIAGLGFGPLGDGVAAANLEARERDLAARLAATGTAKFLESAKAMAAAAEAHAIQNEVRDVLTGLAVEGERVIVATDYDSAMDQVNLGEDEPLRVGRLIPRPVAHAVATPVTDELAGLPASDPDMKLPDYTKAST